MPAHPFEDLVITEVVDATNQPVPPGEYGAKVVITGGLGEALWSAVLALGRRSRPTFSGI
jgi:hypothetical protein